MTEWIQNKIKEAEATLAEATKQNDQAKIKKAKEDIHNYSEMLKI